MIAPAFVLAVSAVVSVGSSDGSEGSRLKMGVLKRPDALRCKTKSRVGDVLAVHATVGFHLAVARLSTAACTLSVSPSASQALPSHSHSR